MRHVHRLVLVALVAGSAAGAATTDTFVRAVHVSLAQPPAEVMAPAVADRAGVWRAVAQNAPVREGERVRTSAGGVMEVRFECGSALRLIPGAEVSFLQLRRDSKGQTTSVVAVDRGKAFLTVRKNDSRSLAIHVAGGQIAGWHGTTRLRIEALDEGGGLIELFGGRARLEVAGNSYRVAKSAKLIWSATVTPHAQAGEGKDRWYRWSQSRDQAYDRLIAQSRPRPSPIAEAGFGPPAEVGASSISAIPNNWDLIGKQSQLILDPALPPVLVPSCAE